VVLEVAAALADRLVSAEARNLREIPVEAARLARHPGPSMVFLGNSLVDEDLDLRTIRLALRSRGYGQVAVAEAAQPGSTVVEWYHILRAAYLEPRRSPTLLVLLALGDHLGDRPRLEARELARLARITRTRAAVADLLAGEAGRFGDRVELVLSRASSLFAGRQRRGLRIRDLALPGYRTNIRRLRALAPAPAPPVPPTYRRLRQLLREARDAGTRVVVVLPPSRDGRGLSPGSRAALRGGGATLLDLRGSGFRPDDFRDAVHLRPDPARRFSVDLVRALERAGTLPLASKPGPPPSPPPSGPSPGWCGLPDCDAF
jgi:hypothetical protein